MKFLLLITINLFSISIVFNLIRQRIVIKCSKLGKHVLTSKNLTKLI